MTLQNIKISLRSDSLENWISSDPVLKNGELVMVNDISAGLVRFKIGNGVSAFMQLPYVNEKKVITDFAKVKRTESQYFSQGVNNFVSPLGFAAGNYITADSSFAQVLGINACSPEGHDYSFVWNGDSSGTIGVQSYMSHGEGTFNVNPVGGVNGFYIGNQTLSGILSSTCQPKGNYLSSNALDGYKTYDNTVASLTAQSGFKTYADAKSSLSSDGYATHAQLDTKSSVSVDNQRADVNILHISQEEYNRLVANDKVLSNFIYVVSGDYVNAYGQQIKNLAPGTDLSDAVNLQQLQAAVESVPLSDYYTKTVTDSKLAGKADTETVYTKQQTDEAISSALSAKEDAKYIESEDGKQRIYGNGDVSTLSSAPGTYGPWTDQDGNVDDTWRVTEISAGVFCYVHGGDYSYRSNDTWSSREEAENAKTFTTNYGNVWTRTYTPGVDSWIKEGELAVKYGKDFNKLSAQQLEIGDSQQVTIDKDGIRTVNGARVSFGPYPDSGGMQAVVLEGSNDGGILLSGVTFAQAIYIDEPYKYDQKTRVATLGEVSSTIDNKLSSYVSKTEVEPYTMIPGFAANAYRASMATMDGNGVEIATDYAKKTDLTAKQDVLPYNQYTGLYDISAFGAAQAAWVKWSGVEDKPTTLAGYGITDAATKTELNELSGIVIAANTQLEEIA